MVAVERIKRLKQMVDSGDKSAVEPFLKELERQNIVHPRVGMCDCNLCTHVAISLDTCKCYHCRRFKELHNLALEPRLFSLYQCFYQVLPDMYHFNKFMKEV
jgi:hypothetical protein